MRITKDAKRFIAKILVAVLIISMMPSFGVEVKADDEVMELNYSGTIESDGSGGYVYVYTDDETGEENSVAITATKLQTNAYIDINCDISLDELRVNYGSLTVNSGKNVTVGTMYYSFDVNNNGTITVTNQLSSSAISSISFDNNGTLIVPNLDSDNVYSFTNNGTVQANSVHLSPAWRPDYSSTCKWVVSSSFSVEGNNTLVGIVEAQRNTLISIDGGSLILRLSGYPDKEIIGENEGTAEELVSGTFEPTGLTLTASGVNYVNGKYYAKDIITISAPTGYSWLYDGTYSNSFNFTSGDTNIPTPKPISGDFRFKNGDGAITELIDVSDYLIPDDLFRDEGTEFYSNIEYDDENPSVLSMRVGSGSDATTVAFENGMEITENSATLIVRDPNLYNVVVSDGRTYTWDSTTYPIGEDGDYKIAEITFSTTAGTEKEFSVTAQDCSLNKLVISFKIGKEEFISSDGLKCTLSGLVNEKYTKDKVTVKAPDGYEIMPSYGTGDKFVESFDYKRSDLYGSDGKFKSGLTFTFKRKSDGAVTKPVAWDKCCDFLDDVVFDEIDPVISTVTADNKTITFKTGDVIEAASVTFTVTDVNLEKIVVDKTVTDRTNGVKKDGNLYKGTVTFKVAAGESKSYKFTAYDMAGRAVEYTFTLKYPRQVPELTVTLSDQFAGVAYTPTITTVSDGAKDVKYYYAENLKASVSANEFSETLPTMPGKYVVKAVIPETNKYLAATAYAEFSIAYLPTPENPYTLDGETGDNDYYTSDVIITPPTGYTICASLTGKYTNTLTYSAALTNIYLKQTSTGALTGPIAFNETLKIDKTAPALSTAAKNQAGNVVDLSKLIYADKVTFTISDEHLSKVTINGEEVSFTDGKVTVSLICNGHKYFNIVAVDEAGNEYSFRVEMKATWLQSGIVPVGILISLVPGEGVALEPGEFIIEDSDDTTVYNGGMEVYVSEETELTLIKVN